MGELFQLLSMGSPVAVLMTSALLILSVTVSIILRGRVCSREKHLVLASIYRRKAEAAGRRFNRARQFD